MFYRERFARVGGMNLIYSFVPVQIGLQYLSWQGLARSCHYHITELGSVFRFYRWRAEIECEASHRQVGVAARIGLTLSLTKVPAWSDPVQGRNLHMSMRRLGASLLVK